MSNQYYIPYNPYQSMYGQQINGMGNMNGMRQQPYQNQYEN